MSALSRALPFSRWYFCKHVCLPALFHGPGLGLPLILRLLLLLLLLACVAATEASSQMKPYQPGDFVPPPQLLLLLLW